MFANTYSKAINSQYEEYVLSVGDFDERIFLGEDADEEIGTPAKARDQVSGEFTERMLVKNNLQQHFESVSFYTCKISVLPICNTA